VRRVPADEGSKRLPGGERGRYGHLAWRASAADARRVDEPIDREDVQTIMQSLIRAQWKLDLILRFLVGGDDEEAEEA
jgi:hypothetical protein